VFARGQPPRPGSCRSLLLLLGLTGLACRSPTTEPASPTPPVDLSAEWNPASPASVDVDADGLARALALADTIPGLESAVIIRRGRLIGERYLGTASAEAVHSIRSVTKGVISLLLGQAIERGVFQGTSERLADTFHPPLPVIEGEAAHITLQDLLTMTSGFEWNENDNPAEYNGWVLAPDQIEYLLARPITSSPGTVWNYNSAAVHLLSAAITSTSGMRTDDFADQFLLGPLGILVRSWELDNRGIPNGGAGLSLRTRDLGKIGQLVLQGGRSGSVQVVPANWVAASTAAQLSTPAGFSSIGALRYGDLWWAGRIGGHGVVLAWGFGGQFILIVSELELVVVTTARWQDLVVAGQGDAILGWIATSILPTVH